METAHNKNNHHGDKGRDERKVHLSSRPSHTLATHTMTRIKTHSSLYKVVATCCRCCCCCCWVHRRHTAEEEASQMERSSLLHHLLLYKCHPSLFAPLAYSNKLLFFHGPHKSVSFDLWVFLLPELPIAGNNSCQVNWKVMSPFCCCCE